MIRDHLNRPITHRPNPDDAGKLKPYYLGPDGEGFIMRDNEGEYILVEGEKRYWRSGKIDLPNPKLFKQLDSFSVGIIKPDAISQGLGDEILLLTQKQGFEVFQKTDVILKPELVRRVWPFFFERKWEKSLYSYLGSSPSRVIIFQKSPQAPPDFDDVASKLLRLRNEVRKLYGVSDPMINIFHASDSFPDAVREALIFFNLLELPLISAI